MPWFVYIARARTGRLYVGMSENPRQRIDDHNRGYGAELARKQGPYSLVYVSSPLESKSGARKREIQLKGWTRVKKERLITGVWR